MDVRLQVDAERPTGTCVVLVEPGGERSMLPDAGANAALAPAPLPPDAAHLHVAGYALLHPGSRPAARAMLAAARAAGVPSPSTRRAPRRSPRRAPARSWTGSPAPALLLPNRDEAAVLERHAPTPRPPRVALTAHAGEVVVKLGADGRPVDGRRRAASACPRSRVAGADTTGAGDAFAAGLLAARLAGAGPAEALRAGCALAAAAVARPGAR